METEIKRCHQQSVVCFSGKRQRAGGLRISHTKSVLHEEQHFHDMCLGISYVYTND